MSVEARNRPLHQWFERIRAGQLALPRFQRFGAWSHANVVQLFNTILQNLPVGAPLVLEVGGEEPFVSRALKGAPETGERVTEHLLDGQQRLTALWRGLHNNYEERTYFVSFSLDEESDLPYHVISVGQWLRQGDTEQRPNPKEQWRRKPVSLESFPPGLDALQACQAWSKAATDASDDPK